MTKIDQQLVWLGEIFPELIRVAQAIIPESVTTAEDLTSDAVFYTLRAIQAGRCTVMVRARFSSYCKNLVRKFARQAFSRYTGDIRIDPAKSSVSKELRPSIRQTSVRKIDQDVFDPYERWETPE